MYERFFGFRELPFRLTPDPNYLFLSRKHGEAFAHLLYAVREGSGFVAVTGEIGAGKTTLVRTLLKELRDTKENVAAAYIFNPVYSPVELLQSINAELGLPSRSGSKKELTENLNAFLLAQKADGGRTVVIVDEAQNLDPMILEELRLLSNLETETEKLLHIVLIGQPELRDLLERPELLQLAQRITVRWHLSSLDRVETAEYVRHRLRVAGGPNVAGIFDQRALNLLYEHSGGVPRLINILAHRALLVAYTKGLHDAGASEVAVAAAELEEGRYPIASVGRNWAYRVAAGIAVALSAAAVALLLLAPLGGGGEEPPEDSASRRTTGAAVGGRVEEAPPPAAEPRAAAPRAADTAANTPTVVQSAANTPPAGKPAVRPAPPHGSKADTGQDRKAQRADAKRGKAVERLSRKLEKSDVFQGATDAVTRLFELWGRDPLSATEAASGSLDLEAIAKLRGLNYLAGEMSSELIAAIDLPAVLEVVLPGEETPRYVLLTSLGADAATVQLDEAVEVPREVLENIWNRRAHILWKDHERFRRSMGPGSGGPAVLRLQALLREAGVYEGIVNGIYGDDSEQAVRNFQERNSLLADGIAGPITQIMLYNGFERFNRPVLIGKAGKSAAGKAS